MMTHQTQTIENHPTTQTTEEKQRKTKTTGRTRYNNNNNNNNNKTTTTKPKFHLNPDAPEFVPVSFFHQEDPRLQKVWEMAETGDYDGILSTFNQMKCLEEQLVFVNYRNAEKNQSTLLHLCAEKGFVRIMQLLYDCGANVNARDGFLNTPLHVAVLHGQSRSVAWLLTHNGLPELKNADYKTPKEMAPNQTGLYSSCLKLFDNPKRKIFDKETILSMKPKTQDS